MSDPKSDKHLAMIEKLENEKKLMQKTIDELRKQLLRKYDAAAKPYSVEDTIKDIMDPSYPLFM
jgi:hypothetical protein